MVNENQAFVEGSWTHKAFEGKGRTEIKVWNLCLVWEGVKGVGAKGKSTV
jgi:hypothetical protein